MEKTFSKNKPACKVTFTFPIEASNGAKKLFLVGDFNDWNETTLPMSKSTKEGVFKKSLDLETGKNYEFKYLSESQDWYNDHCADWYTPSGFTGFDNSVVSLPRQADDLTKIEGIGPKINVALKDKGISTFEELAKLKAKDIKDILDEHGSKFNTHATTSWPKQAKLAAKGEWEKLAKLQNELIGGR